MLADLVSQYSAAEELREGYLTCNARLKYSSLEAQAFTADNPALEMLCAHQFALTLDYPEEILKALEELDERISATFQSYLEASGRAMRFTCSLERLQEQVRFNISQFRAQVLGRLCVARLNVIEEIMAEQSFERAEYYARSTAAKVSEQLGQNHWWRGILLIRQARCLSQMQRLDEAEKVLAAAHHILVEWCCEDEHPLADELKGLESLRKQLCHPMAMS